MTRYNVRIAEFPEVPAQGPFFDIDKDGGWVRYDDAKKECDSEYYRGDFDGRRVMEFRARHKTISILENQEEEMKKRGCSGDEMDVINHAIRRVRESISEGTSNAMRSPGPLVHIAEWTTSWDLVVKEHNKMVDAINELRGRK